MNVSAQIMVDWAPVIGKASLYVGIEALPILYVAFHKFATGEEKVNTWMLAAVVVNSIYHGCVGLRAFFDGSVQRHSDALVEIRKQRVDTQFLTKQQTTK